MRNNYYVSSLSRREKEIKRDSSMVIMNYGDEFYPYMVKVHYNRIHARAMSTYDSNFKGDNYNSPKYRYAEEPRKHIR